jgi:O-methyltransferase
MLKKYIRDKIINLIEKRTNPLKTELSKLRVMYQTMYSESGRINRRQIMNYAFEFVAKSDLDGSYLEFGCFNGTSFIKAFQAYQYWLVIAKKNNWKLKPNTMFAFDSFEGLPELQESDRLIDYDIFDKGQYTCSEEAFRKNLNDAGVDMNLVNIIPGFYSESLNKNLKAQLSMIKAIIVHIDCDLYSSACCVLDFVTDLLQDGTLILFDDFFCYRGNHNYGVQKAFYEWKHDNNIQASSYLNYSWAGKAFIISQ